MKTLVFDEIQHRYTVDGVVVPSVTTVLSAVGIPDLSFANKEVLKASSEFGTAAHLACELYDKGELDEDALDPALRPILDQWIVLPNEMCAGMTEVLIEKRLYSKQYGFAGTLDRAYFNELKKALVIVDIKTGANTPSAGPQTAAYAQLVSEEYGIKFRTVKRYTAHLLHGKEFGKLVQYTDPADWPVFLSALNIYKYKNKR